MPIIRSRARHKVLVGQLLPHPVRQPEGGTRMYELRPESIKTFISDRTVKLPRFQRKQTWDSKKNFELCLSLFRDIPLGVVVIRVDTRERVVGSRRPVLEKHLIDGRQRLNVLTKASNPEEIYAWAKEALRLRNTQSLDEVTERFWRYVDDYFGEEATDDTRVDPADIPELEPKIGDDAVPGQADDEDRDEGVAEGPGGVGVVTTSAPAPPLTDMAGASRNGPGAQGLQELLDIILVVHPKRPAGSGFTKPFDLRRFVPTVDYIKTDPATGRGYVDSAKLAAWIQFKRASTAGAHAYPGSVDEFMDWLGAPQLPPPLRGRLKEEVSRRWRRMESVFSALDSIDKRLQEAKIGYLEIRDCSANEERKIFVIINSAGTPLTAAEILSAKPAWNKLVENPDPTIILQKEAMYREAGIPIPDTTVRWDTAATLFSRLRASLVIG